MSTCSIVFGIVFSIAVLLLLHAVWHDVKNYHNDMKDVERLRELQQQFDKIDEEFEEDLKKLDSQQKQPLNLRKNK